ncbi:galactoside o-acetyltransferase [Apiospora arundinis]
MSASSINENIVAEVAASEVFVTSRKPELQEFKITMRRKMLLFNDSSIPEGAALQTLTTRCMAVVKGMFGRLSAKVNIELPCFMIWCCNIFVGDGLYKNCGRCICPITHALDPEVRREASGTSFAHPIHIDDDCWIGARALIIPGVRIGRGSTVAARAVVAQDMEPYCLVGVYLRS